jgi:hypothetical protein
MAGRPCKPDADFVRLWRVLMPGTPFPACGITDDSDAQAKGLMQTPADARDDESFAAASEVRRRVNRR